MLPKRKKAKENYDYSSFYVGTKFVHKETDSIIYEIAKIKGSDVHVSWEGSGKPVSFSFESARRYFKEGEWIQI